MLKRSIDFVVALSLLIVLWPLLALLALAVRWKLGNPVLFAQDRPGLDGAPFKFYKFRSMRDVRDTTGELLLAEFRATRETLSRRARPNRTILLDARNPAAIGALILLIEASLSVSLALVLAGLYLALTVSRVQQ